MLRPTGAPASFTEPSTPGGTTVAGKSSFTSSISTRPSMTIANSSCAAENQSGRALGAQRLDHVLAVLRDDDFLVGRGARGDVEHVRERVALDVVVDDLDVALDVACERAEGGRRTRRFRVAESSLAPTGLLSASEPVSILLGPRSHPGTSFGRVETRFPAPGLEAPAAAHGGRGQGQHSRRGRVARDHATRAVAQHPQHRERARAQARRPRAARRRAHAGRQSALELRAHHRRELDLGRERAARAPRSQQPHRADRRSA